MQPRVSFGGCVVTVLVTVLNCSPAYTQSMVMTKMETQPYLSNKAAPAKAYPQQ